MQRLTKLSELPIGDDEGSKTAKTTQSFISVLLRLFTADGRSGTGGISAFDLLCLPDEILEQVALVLGQEEVLRLFNDISEIGDETSAFSREPCRGVGKSA